MKPGDRVVRNPKYKWCLCARYSLCWCRKGAFVVAEAKEGVSQTRLLVKVTKAEGALDFVDSSYFLPESA